MFGGSTFGILDDQAPEADVGDALSVFDQAGHAFAHLLVGVVLLHDRALPGPGRDCSSRRPW